ncbi:MAG: peptidase C39, partial [Prochlorococcaceae cyanobacterium]
MTSAPSAGLERLWALKPFAAFTPIQRQKFAARCVLERFQEGQRLSGADLVGHRALVILEGEARLLAVHDGLPFTIERLGPGALVGMASLLRAEGCEEVSAATPLLVAALPDAVALELLLDTDHPLGRHCRERLWTAELSVLLERLDAGRLGAAGYTPEAWRRRLQELQGRVRLLPATADALAAR